MTQATVNIGTVGHVDHGKTTLVYKLSGVWADKHSEEVKRGITIKLGYADVTFRKCVSCGAYTAKEKCEECGGETKDSRKVSFVDAPGHETLMATVIAASSIMDGALFVIAANEQCPQLQTQEHLMVLEASGIKNVVITQNKVDLVSREQALKHYRQIRGFLKVSAFEHAPIIPTAANAGINLGALIKAIEEHIPTPERYLQKPPRFLVARSFDVNKPGTEYKKLLGAVVGGSLVEGKIVEGDEIAILPGSLHQKEKGKESYEPLATSVKALHAGGQKLGEVMPGGLVGVSTTLDPSLARGDALVGCVLGRKNEMPEVWQEITAEVTPLKRVLQAFPGFQPNEPVVVGVGTATTIGFVSEGKQKKGFLHLKLKKPVCANKGEKIALLRRAKNRWRLYASAKIV